jgi:DNA-binding LacI/PurR family transcriptional regulator
MVSLPRSESVNRLGGGPPAASSSITSLDINRDSSAPLYEQIRQGIFQKIETGEWPPDYMLPPYKELLGLWGVSMITIQQSVGNLIKEGVLYRKRGVGVFVANRRMGKKTRSIALFIPDVRHPFFSMLAHTIQTLAFRHGYILSVFSLDARSVESVQQLEAPLDNDFDGIITTPTIEKNLGQIFPRLNRRDIPIVFVDGMAPSDAYSYVEVDNHRAFELVIDHLISLGHRQIGFISGQPMTIGVVERLKAFESIMQERNLPLSPPRIQISHHLNDEGGAHAADTLLALRDAPTAIICSNDLAAVGALRTLRRLGRSCPGDVSIVGFDALELSDHLEPPLTTVRQPVVEMGRIALKLLLAQLENAEPQPVERHELAPDLIVRGSTGPVPR